MNHPLSFIGNNSDRTDIRQASPANPIPVAPPVSNNTPIANTATAVTVTTPAALLTACTGWIALDPTANWVVIDVETDAIRITFDGTTPTASLGYKFGAGFKGLALNRAEVIAAKVIRVSTDATLQVSQFK